jgi:outer membrane lipoprotein-sorting protein
MTILADIPKAARLWRGLALAVMLLALCAPPALARAPVAAQLSERDRADLRRIENYLESIHTMRAGFEQTDPNGQTEEGQFYLSRPGKMRFEYAPPSQLVVVSDGNYVAVNDQEMKQIQFYPVDATPVWFLLREGIRLSGDVTVTRFERGEDTLRVTATQTGSANAGAITLILSDHPLQLVKWTIVDPQRNSTTIAILDPQFGGALADSLFALPNRAGNAAPRSH